VYICGDARRHNVVVSNMRVLASAGDKLQISQVAGEVEVDKMRRSQHQQQALIRQQGRQHSSFLRWLNSCTHPYTASSVRICNLTHDEADTDSLQTPYEKLNALVATMPVALRQLAGMYPGPHPRPDEPAEKMLVQNPVELIAADNREVRRCVEGKQQEQEQPSQAEEQRFFSRTEVCERPGPLALRPPVRAVSLPVDLKKGTLVLLRSPLDASVSPVYKDHLLPIPPAGADLHADYKSWAVAEVTAVTAGEQDADISFKLLPAMLGRESYPPRENCWPFACAYNRAAFFTWCRSRDPH
jgi:hypothetical protein